MTLSSHFAHSQASTKYYLLIYRHQCWKRSSGVCLLLFDLKWSNQILYLFPPISKDLVKFKYTLFRTITVTVHTVRTNHGRRSRDVQALEDSKNCDGSLPRSRLLGKSSSTRVNRIKRNANVRPQHW